MGKAGGAALQPVGVTGASSTLAAASGDVHLYFLAPCGDDRMSGAARKEAELLLPPCRLALEVGPGERRVKAVLLGA